MYKSCNLLLSRSTHPFQQKINTKTVLKSSCSHPRGYVFPDPILVDSFQSLHLLCLDYIEGQFIIDLLFPIDFVFIYHLFTSLFTYQTSESLLFLCSDQQSAPLLALDCAQPFPGMMLLTASSFHRSLLYFCTWNLINL